MIKFLDSRSGIVIRRLSAGAIICGGFYLFMYLLFSGDWGQFFTAGFFMVCGFLISRPTKTEMRELIKGLFIIAAGFWSICFFMKLGWVEWPIRRVGDIYEYLRLSGSHASVGMGVLGFVLLTGTSGSFMKPGKSGGFCGWVLCVSAAGLWLGGIVFLNCHGIAAEGCKFGFILICAAKAFITGFVEEVCYRGVLLELSRKCFGNTGGIIFQGTIYMIFHVSVGAALGLGRWEFLVGVWAFGILAGTVTVLTGGIGWGVLVHWGIGMVIEWQNLC